MSGKPISLSKADVRRAMVAYHFAQADLDSVLKRLRSVQFDPLSPAGCNHDLVLQSRVPGYKIGDWQRPAYRDRLVYDGWDKQASIVLSESWAVRRIYHRWYAGWFDRFKSEHKDALDAVLGELAERGPLLPGQFSFQRRVEDWKGSWYGPSVTKRALRVLWHTGRVMTHSRKGNQHLYHLTESVMPAEHLAPNKMSDEKSIEQILFWRHEAMGLIRPSPAWEVWSMPVKADVRKGGVSSLLKKKKIVPVDIEGQAANASPEFLKALDRSVDARAVRFIAPLDQFIWDRKMIQYLFGFDYLWEVYVPLAKRKWGYYVLPILHGDKLIARCDVWSRKGVLEIRAWHWEQGEPANPAVKDDIREGVGRFLNYLDAHEAVASEMVDAGTRDLCSMRLS